VPEEVCPVFVVTAVTVVTVVLQDQLPRKTDVIVNRLNDQLGPICHSLALLAAHHILHVSRIRVNHFFLFQLNAHNMSNTLDLSPA